MNELLLKSWKILALRGAVSLMFGILAAMWPGLTLMWLIGLFAAFALISGVASMAAGVQNRTSNSEWWLPLLLGLISVIAGVAAILTPSITALVLVLLMGANALVSGIIDIVMAIRLRKIIEGEGFLILNGIVSVLFGIFVFFFPGAGALALVWLISIYATVSGILLLALAWRAHSWASEHGTPHGHLPAHG